MKYKQSMKRAELTNQNLITLKQVEQLAYRGTPHAEMQRCNTWQSVADYCECEISELRIYLTDDWYVLLAEHEDYIEFVDLASRTKHTPLLQIINVLTQYKKPFIMDCRENTSYRMVKALEKAGRIEIQQDEIYSRGGETFHDIRLELLNKQDIQCSQRGAMNYI